MTVMSRQFAARSSAVISAIITTGVDILHQRANWRGGGVDDTANLRGRETRTERRRIDAVGLALWLLV